MATQLSTGTGRVITTDSSVLKGGGLDFDTGTLIFDIGTKFLHLLEGALILFIGILVMRYVRSYLQRIQVAHENQRMALNLLEKLSTGFFMVITVTLALKVIGLDLTLLISALALGLSFGLKDIIKNYVSGILILFKSPFSIGDIVKIKRFIGRVERIDFQSTTLKTFDQKEITVYNKDILSRSITNYSKEPMRRIEIAVTLGRGTDTAKALVVFEAILEKNEKVLKNPRYSIVFHRFQEQGMRVVIRFWVKRPCNILYIRSEIALQIEQAFDEQAIYSPYVRNIQFGNDISMTEERKNRIQAFYHLPILANIAKETEAKLNAIFTAPEETLLDREEPEWDESE